jgi:hypothetical protein
MRWCGATAMGRQQLDWSIFELVRLQIEFVFLTVFIGSSAAHDQVVLVSPGMVQPVMNGMCLVWTRIQQTNKHHR